MSMKCLLTVAAVLLAATMAEAQVRTQIPQQPVAAPRAAAPAASQTSSPATADPSGGAPESSSGSFKWRARAPSCGPAANRSCPPAPSHWTPRPAGRRAGRRADADRPRHARPGLTAV